MGYAALLHGLHQAGFVSLDRPPEYYGLGLALGNGDVTLLELANGYRALANGGVWTPTRWWPGERAAPVPAWCPPARPPSRSTSCPMPTLASRGSDFAHLSTGPSGSRRRPAPAGTSPTTGPSRSRSDSRSRYGPGTSAAGRWKASVGSPGAGPLLHRAVLVTAASYAPGVLPEPEEAGLVPATICRVSGLRASPECPSLTEYFVPGSIPGRYCDWHREGFVRLPTEFAEWRATADGRLGDRAPLGSALARLWREGVPWGGSAARQLGTSSRDSAAPFLGSLTERASRLAITSPQHGDHYRLPPGVDPRYASIALRATGIGSTAAVRWYVDGRRVATSRWVLRAGRHEIRAEAGSDRAAVRITVDGP